MRKLSLLLFLTGFSVLPGTADVRTFTPIGGSTTVDSVGEGDGGWVFAAGSGSPDGLPRRLWLAGFNGRGGSELDQEWLTPVAANGFRPVLDYIPGNDV